MGKRLPDNIEPKKFPGHDFRTGYSNIGVVRILGTSGNYRIEMGYSNENRANGIAGKHVRGNCADLETVSTVIKNLKIEERDGVKVVLCI